MKLFAAFIAAIALAIVMSTLRHSWDIIENWIDRAQQHYTLPAPA